MTPQHVQARIDKRGSDRCQSSCPGWVVRTNPGAPKLMACVACNARHQARLQVTDKMVKLLPAARAGLASIMYGVRRARIERATTRHMQTAPNDTTALCGRELGRTRSGRRTHVVVYVTSIATCAECIRLSAMTPAERAAEKEAASAMLRFKFADKREQAARERRERDEATADEIALARADAHVAVDIMEEVFGDKHGIAFDRVRLMVEMAGDNPALMARATFFENTLRMTVVAHRHANPKSRGERRWLFRTDTEGRRHINQTNVVCRFCEAVLLTGRAIGNDYTIETDVHTVRCALEYLGGKLPTTTTDPDASDESDA